MSFSFPLFRGVRVKRRKDNNIVLQKEADCYLSKELKGLSLIRVMTNFDFLQMFATVKSVKFQRILLCGNKRSSFDMTLISDSPFKVMY